MAKMNVGARIDPYLYTQVIDKLRSFFRDRGFLEATTQSRLSILAACEDPQTMATMVYAGEKWPLPQTGQMWLERELLEMPQSSGFFCLTTSYRNEASPIEGRHDLIFPMFEFELPGNIQDLIELERDLIQMLGFNRGTIISYADACSKYNTEELTPDDEQAMYEDFGNAVFLTDFPATTDPFWNMKFDGVAAKVDVILFGTETIGSAERDTDAEKMRHRFYALSEGEYAKTLISEFGKERVSNELEDFLSLNFFPRIGGGIGLTRLVQAIGKLG